MTTRDQTGALDGIELLQAPERMAVADASQLLATLATLHRLRAHLDQWEPTLITAARDRGVTWAQIAPALGLASRQAAERRYLRLKPQTADQPGTTREHRVQTTRDQRSADRALADWPRRNAAALRQLAGQITALTDTHTNNGAGTGSTTSPTGVSAAIGRVRDVLGSNDAADLLQPLAAAEPSLPGSHPGLANQIPP